MAPHSKAVAVSSIYLVAYACRPIPHPLTGPCSEHYGCSTLGKFLSDWGAVCTREMDWTQLKLLIEGIEIGRRRKRVDLGSSPSNIFDHNAAGVPIIR